MGRSGPKPLPPRHDADSYLRVHPVKDIAGTNLELMGIGNYSREALLLKPNDTHKEMLYEDKD